MLEGEAGSTWVRACVTQGFRRTQANHYQQSLRFFSVFVPEQRLGGEVGERRVCFIVLLTNWSLLILFCSDYIDFFNVFLLW